MIAEKRKLLFFPLIAVDKVLNLLGMFHMVNEDL